MERVRVAPCAGRACDAARRKRPAAFMVAGMRTPAVDRLLRRDDMELLSLGEPAHVGSALEGIRVDAPVFAVTAIPERAYGAQPSRPIEMRERALSDLAAEQLETTKRS